MMDGKLPPNLAKTLKAEQARTAESRARGLRKVWLSADHKEALLLCEVDNLVKGDNLAGAQGISAGYPGLQAGPITHEIHEPSPDVTTGHHDGSAD